MNSPPNLDGIILCGGKALRMGGKDKGLIQYKNKSLVEFAINTLQPQCNNIIINTNRNLDIYKQFSFPVVNDQNHEYLGPLAGIAACSEHIKNPYIAVIPCDMPHLPMQAINLLLEKLNNSHAEIAVASTNKRLQPLVFIMKKSVADQTQNDLQKGHRKMSEWIKKYHYESIDFSQHIHWFSNINHPQDLLD